MWLVEWEIEGIPVGSGQIGPDRMGIPISLAYFCPDCARVWARARIAGRRFQVVARRCSLEKPRYLEDRPGTLITELWPAYAESLPTPVLDREMEILWQLKQLKQPEALSSLGPSIQAA